MDERTGGVGHTGLRWCCSLAAGWFLVVHGGDLLPAIGRMASLGPHVLPLAFALLALGVVNRGLQARSSYRLVELPASLAAMTGVAASSYATNKVVKSGGTAGLVPVPLPRRPRGSLPGPGRRGLHVDQARGDAVAVRADHRHGRRRAAVTGGLHGTALFGAIASAGYALVVGIGVVLVASRRSLLEAVAPASPGQSPTVAAA